MKLLALVMSMKETCKKVEIALIGSLPTMKKIFPFHLGFSMCPFNYKGVFCYPTFNVKLLYWSTLPAVSGKAFIFISLDHYSLLPTEEQSRIRESGVKSNRVTSVRHKKDTCQKHESAYVAPPQKIVSKRGKEPQF